MSEEKANISVIKHLDSLKAIEVAADSKVEKKFIELYNTVHGSKMGESLYQKERFNFEKLLQENQALQECTKLSLYGCFLDIAVNGLSLDQSKPLCYIIPRSIKVKENGAERWEKRASISITGPGELVMRMRFGQIRYADNPVIVYDGDTFEAEIDFNGNKVVKYKACIPRKSNKIIAAFIRIVRNDSSTDYQWLLENDFLRLKKYSETANKGSANALYSSLNGGIDSGFLENKMIKHAFDSYPKVRTGDFSQLESHQEPTPINYGIANDEKDIDHAINTVDVQAEDVTQNNDAFGAQQPDENSGISFNNDETF